MENIINAWFSLFGNPWWFLLPEKADPWIKEKWASINWKQYWSLRDSLDINSKSRYWLFFTPNWNLWNKNVPWADVVRTADDAEEYLSCIWVDCDKKESKTWYASKSNEEYWEYIRKTLEENAFRAHYVVKSGWWWHLYCFVKPEDRKELWKISKDDLKILETTIASMFDWWDPASISMAKLLRVPTSMHWKHVEWFQTELYKTRVDDNWKLHFDLVTSPDQITLEWLAMPSAKWVIQFIEDQKKPKLSVTKDQKWMITDSRTKQVDSLNIEEIINHLEKYPRLNDNWEKVIFRTNWDRIWFLVNWRRVSTDWYRINKAKNYVNNFSMFSMEQRPIWEPFSFLYYYFRKDVAKMNEFLSEEFGMQFLDEWGTNTFLKVNTDNGIIFFQEDWVYYRSAKLSWKKTEEINEKLFDSPFMIKWLCRTRYDKKWETDSNNMYLVISLLDREETDPENTILEIYSSAQKFNDAYQKRWLTFMKDDKLLREFYSWMKKGWQQWIIKKYDFKYLNWYYEDFYLEWDRTYDYQWEQIDRTNLPIVFQNPDIEHCIIEKEVTMSEYWELLRTIFVDKEAMLAYVTFIALAIWDKFWSTYLNWDEQQIILPWLILSWHTKSWKSTLVNYLLNGFWLSSVAKKKSVKGTTLQPLKQMATDDFPMHREEFTWEIGLEKENLIRDVLNKTRTARWMLDWSNAEYIYRAWLILDWERLPESESVVNRCVSIPMNPEWRIGTPKTLRALERVGYKKDFIRSLYNLDITRVKDDFRAAQDTCYENWIPDRYSMMYWFLVCVNRWFNIYFEDELLEQIKNNLQDQDEIQRENTVLAMLLNDLCIQYHVKPMYMPNQDDFKITIPVPNAYARQKQTDILDIISKYWKQRVAWKKWTLSINLFSKWKDDTPEREEIYNTFAMYRQYMQEARFSDINFLDKDI